MCGHIWCNHRNVQKHCPEEDPAQAPAMIKMTFSLRNAIIWGDMPSHCWPGMTQFFGWLIREVFLP